MRSISHVFSTKYVYKSNSMHFGNFKFILKLQFIQIKYFFMHITFYSQFNVQFSVARPFKLSHEHTCVDHE